jgi:hypothetical protein
VVRKHAAGSTSELLAVGTQQHDCRHHHNIPPSQIYAPDNG